VNSLTTDAIVLHAFDYLETSRIVRLLTRDAGVVSVLARGARRSRARYGSGLDLYAQGVAQISIKPQRELHNLNSLEVVHSRAGIAGEIGRFTAAAVISELIMRFVGEESGSHLFDVASHLFDEIAEAAEAATIQTGVAGAWRLIAALGLSPALDVCASCHSDIPAGSDALFSHRAGGVLCAKCGALASASRRLPASARSAINSWLETERTIQLTQPEQRAHQRLLREFVQEHLGEDRPLRAFHVWERERWSEP
jgi:DNA repair protein RecO (recombination protein O)